MSDYVRVSEGEGEDIIEIPLEIDGTLLLSTLTAQFSGACGLKYRVPETKTLRGIKLVEDRLVSPDEGWEYDFFCSFPKVEAKRKSADLLESSTHKARRLDIVRKCSDLIVLGLPWKTTEEQLKEHFSVYGEVIMSQIKKDLKTGQSKGYGFIRFEDYEAQRRVLSKRHFIEGRSCDVKIPNSKDSSNPYMSGKVFVGRTTEDISAADLREYFETFGEVTDVYIPKPFRAFSFVTFLDPEVAMRLCGEDHIIKGVSVNVSNATPKGGGDGQKDRVGYGGSRFYAGGDHSSDRGNIRDWNKNHRGDKSVRNNWGNYQGGNNNSGNGRGSHQSWNNESGRWNNGGGAGNWNGPADLSGVFDPKNINMNALTMPIMAALGQQLLSNMSSGVGNSGGMIVPGLGGQQELNAPQQGGNNAQIQTQGSQVPDMGQGSGGYNGAYGNQEQQIPKKISSGPTNWSNSNRERYSR